PAQRNTTASVPSRGFHFGGSMKQILVVLLGLLASLLGLPVDQADPTQWGEPALLGVVVWAIVEYLQHGPLRNLKGIAVTIAAAIVGVALAVALGIAEVLTGAPMEWVITGITATFA